MRTTGTFIVAIIAACLATATIAHAQGFGPARQVANLVNVSAVAYPPGDRTRLFILTLQGRVHILENGTTVRPTLFLDASAAVGGSANGATGLCVDPDFAGNGYVYVFHSLAGGSQVALARYRVSDADPNVADPASRLVILQNPGSAQHTGGWIGLGRDGYLYVSGGDAWSSGGSPQNNTQWTGKMFRLDIRSDAFPAEAMRNYAIPPTNPFAGAITGLDEIWAIGIRNAYRCSFDRLSGDLWIADVGGRQREEVNRQPAASGGGENYGWPCWEGNIRNQSCAAGPTYTFPVLDLVRSQNSCILGGYVYRGCANRAMYGHYVFSRCWSSPQLWSFDPADPVRTLVQRSAAGLGGQVLGFGEDADGELYVCGTTGLFKLTPPADTWILDCNGNGREDACEIKDGSATDANGDGLPDSCTRLCPADFDANGAVGIGDVFWYLNRWFSLAPEADFNGIGGVTIQDLFDFLAAYFRGCA